MSTDEIDPPDDITDEERSELELEKSSLINSLEAELREESRSAPQSPESRFLSRPVHDLLSVPPLGLSVSTPSSPFRSGTIPRTSSVRDLVRQFDTASILIMSDLETAKAEAADSLSQLGHAKGWITRHLNAFDVLEAAGTLTSDKFTVLSDKVQIQIDKLMTYHAAIFIIYSKHNVVAEFKTIGDGITEAIDRAQDGLKHYAALAKRHVAVVAPDPPGDNVTKAQLLDVMSRMGSNNIKINFDCPIFYGDEDDRLEFSNWLIQFETIV